MDRRSFLQTAGAVTVGAMVLPQAFGRAFAAGAPPLPRRCNPPRVRNPYGPLRDPDANGIRLPDGFTSRVVARTDEPVGSTSYRWHQSPDGGAVFGVPGTRDYVYVSNAETLGVLGGGTSAIRFSRNGEILDAYRILSGTNINCAGGPTPWRTWLSGEELPGGQIWECNPFVASQGVARPALGFFVHEAAAVDPRYRHVYLTEDRPDGRFYRFTPTSWPSLASGKLEVARVDGTAVSWIEVSNGPVGATSPRPAGSTAFAGGEGIFWDDGRVYFTTKGDNRVWEYDPRLNHLCVLYDDDTVAGAPLRGVDNIVTNHRHEIFVAEDGDDLQINMLRPGSFVGPLLQIVGQTGTEITGPAFGPANDRLYFSSQRGLGGLSGITYEVRGPFRRGAFR